MEYKDIESRAREATMKHFECEKCRHHKVCSYANGCNTSRDMGTRYKFPWDIEECEPGLYEDGYIQGFQDCANKE